MTSKRVHFENLDALRFLAFFSVFLQHSFFTRSPELAANPVFRAFVQAAHHGELGVNFFFVLSGFLITYLLLVEEQLASRIDAPAFYLRRVLRIWPLYFACVAAGFFLVPLLKGSGAPQEAPRDLFWYITFLPNFDRLFNGAPDSVLGILWSVGIEEQFYLFWPLLMLLVRRQRGALFASILVGSFAFRVFHRERPDWLYYHTISVISDMSLGGIAAWFCHGNARFLARVTALSRRAIVAGYVLGFATIALRGNLFAFPWARPFERLATGLFFAFVILEQCFAERSIWKLGRWRFATRWGTYTYGLYCLHNWGLQASIRIVNPFGLNESFFGVVILQTAVSLVISLAISWCSYHLMEKWFLKLKVRFSYVTRS